jgi:hypothetical protein
MMPWSLSHKGLQIFWRHWRFEGNLRAGGAFQLLSELYTHRNRRPGPDPGPVFLLRTQPPQKKFEQLDPARAALGQDGKDLGMVEKR